MATRLKTPPHRDLRHVRAPDLVASVYGQVAQQVGGAFYAPGLAHCFRFLVYRHEPHQPHQVAEALFANAVAADTRYFMFWGDIATRLQIPPREGALLNLVQNRISLFLHCLGRYMVQTLRSREKGYGSPLARRSAKISRAVRPLPASKLLPEKLKALSMAKVFCMRSYS